MLKLIATFEIVTPMFLGGADQAASRIRESSIKGALAFWWRAMQFPKHLQASNGKEELALKSLQNAEQALFGGPKGQGIFLLKISRQPSKIAQPQQALKTSSGKVVGEGARYLGYGLIEAFGPKGGNLRHRSALEDSQQFELSIVFKPQRSLKNEDFHEQLVSALKFMGLVGGLGSRVRRGWGSISLVALEGAVFEAAKSIEEYKSQIRDIISPIPRFSAPKLPITAISESTRIMVVNGGRSQDSLMCLDHVGRQMQRYRSWGFSGGNRNCPPTVNGAPSEKNFRDDHDWSKKDSNLPSCFVPRRISFGLPQNYKDNDGVTGTGGIDRRGSPLLVHIHRLADGQAFPVLCLLPARFLPNSKVSANGKHKDYDFFKEGLPVLNHFLSSKVPSSNAKDPFRHGPYLDIDEIALGVDK